MTNKQILVIAGGGKKHLAPFEAEGKRLGLEVKVASFSDLHYGSTPATSLGTSPLTTELFVCDRPLSDFGLIYVRLVGKRYEDLALLVSEAKKLRIPVVDRVFTDSGFARLPVSKLLEAKILTEVNLPTPKTIFDRLAHLYQKAPKAFGYPFVLKSTTGKQGHNVWAPRNEGELDKLLKSLKLLKEEKKGKRFLAQQFIRSPKRIRALVVGERVIGAIVRPTRWRKRFSDEPVEKRALTPIPEEISKLAVKAAKAMMLDIAGVDILVEENTNKPYILEVNSAPRWEAINKDCGVNVEVEILKFLTSVV